MRISMKQATSNTLMFDPDPFAENGLQKQSSIVISLRTPRTPPHHPFPTAFTTTYFVLTVSRNFEKVFLNELKQFDLSTA